MVSREKFVQVPTADGLMETFISLPDNVPCPGVILYMDVWGVRNELFDIARMLSKHGYAGIVPDLYYRQGKIRYNFRDASGKMISESALDEKTRREVIETSLRLTNDMVVADTEAILRFLTSHEPDIRTPIGTVGFCMGGRHALYVAAAFPQIAQATVSLHGTALISDKPDSPHLKVAQMRGEIYCGFAEHDRFAPPEVIAKLGQLMNDAPVKYSREIHPGTTHGYSLPDRDVHDPGATARDWVNILAMYERVLR